MIAAETFQEMLDTWADPPAIYRGAPFWSWNSKLDPQRLCRAIESMHAAGMGGFFMHSRYGLKTPYLSEEWFECISACVQKARELGMKAYLYDEDRWPSGSAGGLVTRKHAEFRAHALLSTPAEAPAEGAERIATFHVRLDEAGRLVSYEPVQPGEAHEAAQAAAPPGKLVSFDVVVAAPSGWYNDGTYLDTMNAEAVGDFLHVTHQAYADRYGRDFGDLIPAIFTDEPNYLNVARRTGAGEHAVPWTPSLPRQFRARRGYDVRDRLPEVIFPAAEGEFSKVRHDYFRTVTELFVENFSRQIGRWCGKHKIALTGHMLSEETLGSQVRVVGACMPHYEHMQWPGIDILTDQSRELTTAKQCSSVADQLGRGRVLSELYGCTGWDWPLEGHKYVGDWQFAAGVNFRCPHLTHFSLAGGAKRDYPASIFSHSPWWKYYRVVEDYFARLSFMLTQGTPVRDVLVIHPVESAWGCCHGGQQQDLLDELNGAMQRIARRLSGQHYDWDFADESLLAAHGKVAARGIKVGRMTYKLVLVPPSVTLRSTTAALLGRFVDRGGAVLFVGRRPDRLDGEIDDTVAELISKADTCDQLDRLVGVLTGMLPRRVSVSLGGTEQEAIWAMLRKVTGGQVLFLQSHDRCNTRKMHVSVAGKVPVVLWDAQSGRRRRLQASGGKGSRGRVEFDLALPPTGSALLTLGLPARDAADPAAEPTVATSTTIDGPFEIELTEPNTLPLDYCCYSFGDEEFSEPMPTLKADELIRARFGLGTRLGREHQPWYLYAMGTVDTAPRGRCRLRFRFHVTDVPSRCALALERPEDYQVTVNGQPAGEPTGWWVDEDIRTLDVTSLLAPGDNEVLLTLDYRPDMELEDAQLVGDFGVALRDDGRPAPDNTTLVAPPTHLKLGPWVGQGLDFYGGAVRYKLTVTQPADGRRVRIRLPDVACTAAAIHVGGKSFLLPWPPFAADVTDALEQQANEVLVEVVGGRKNILGPLHVPWKPWTGPGEFDPNNGDWTREYQLTAHGLMKGVVIETLG